MVKKPFLDCFGHSRQQQTTNDNLQKTDTYLQIIVQPDLSQGLTTIPSPQVFSVTVP